MASSVRTWLLPPFTWVAYPPLLLVFVAVLIVVAGVGDGLGAPSLFWHDLPFTQLLAGGSVSVLCVHLGFVSYLLDTQENASVAPLPATIGSVARYLRWPLSLLLLACVVGALRRGPTRFHGGLAFVGPVLVLAFVWLGRARFGEHPVSRLLPASVRDLLKRSVMWLSRMSQRHPPVEDLDIHAVAAAFVYAGVVGYIAAWMGERAVTAAMALCLALGILVGLWGFFRFWFRRYRFLIIAVLLVVGALLGNVLNDASITGFAKVTFPTSGTPPRPLLDDADAFRAWRTQVSEANPPLVVVATSGGASRAAVWTLTVLGSLERHHPGFLRHVRIITGASGGMVGAAHLVSAMAERRDPSAPLDAAWFDGIVEGAARDSLTAIARAVVFPNEDRGLALERVWEDNTDQRLAKPFRDLLALETAGTLPSLVYTPMMVEDGRRLVVSNLQLDGVTMSLRPWTTPVSIDVPSISSLQLFEFGGDGIDRVKLSTVARLNATFPWVTSAARLTSEPDRRLVDAGYYDNYGVDIATAWIRKNAAWLQRNTSGVLLIEIRDAQSKEANVTAEPGPSFVTAHVSGLSTPIEAFLHAREASMSFRNDQKVEALAAELGSDPTCRSTSRFFATQVFDYQGNAPLEWYLSRAAIDDLKVPPAPELLDAVDTWWRTRVETVGPTYFGPCPLY